MKTIRKRVGSLVCAIMIMLCFADFAFSENKNKDVKFEIDRKSVGVIRNDKGKEIGSAFIVGKKKFIVTCAHVAIQGKYKYRGVKTTKDISIKSLFFLPKHDLSVFTLEESIGINPLKFGDINRIRPGDTIVYIGWDKDLSKLKVNKAIVTSMGSVLNQGEIIEFLEFEGEGKPGYSGGPVFDTNGNVIALMREGWTKQGVKGGETKLINRAFSVNILSIFDKEVFSLKKVNQQDNCDTDELMTLINVRR